MDEVRARVESELTEAASAAEIQDMPDRDGVRRHSRTLQLLFERCGDRPQYPSRDMEPLAWQAPQ